MANRDLTFDEGYRTYTINGDPDRIIKVSTTDYGILNRAQEAENNINAKLKEYDHIKINPDGSSKVDTDEAIAAIKDLTEFIESQINYIFNSDIAGVVFNGQSCLSSFRGVLLYERFIKAINAEMEKDFKAEEKATQDRIRKYTTNSGANKYKKKGKKR